MKHVLNSQMFTVQNFTNVYWAGKSAAYNCMYLSVTNVIINVNTADWAIS